MPVLHQSWPWNAIERVIDLRSVNVLRLVGQEFLWRENWRIEFSTPFRVSEARGTHNDARGAGRF